VAYSTGLLTFRRASSTVGAFIPPADPPRTTFGASTLLSLQFSRMGTGMFSLLVSDFQCRLWAIFIRWKAASFFSCNSRRSARNHFPLFLSQGGGYFLWSVGSRRYLLFVLRPVERLPDFIELRHFLPSQVFGGEIHGRFITPPEADFSLPTLTSYPGRGRAGDAFLLFFSGSHGNWFPLKCGTASVV